MTASLEVVRGGPLTLIQDRGRPGLAQIGVGASGAADRRSYELANRLVGNHGGAAAIETTLGGLEVTARGADLWVALAGAPAPMRVEGVEVSPHSVELVRDGQRLAVGTPAAGLRSYLAIRGGLAVPEVLGSRSRDVMAEIGHEPLSAGATLPVGDAAADFPTLDHAPIPPQAGSDAVLRAVRGPRDSWVAEPDTLVTNAWTASAHSNRIGVRLDGPRLEPASGAADQLPSEGAWRGAVQVPPSGQPVLLLADHPVTGGYPVIAVVVDADVDRAAQVRPGEAVRFVWSDAAPWTRLPGT